MSNHNANKLQKIIKQAAFGQGVTPMVSRPAVSPAGGPSVSAAGGSGGDSPQLSAAINELGRGLERTTGRPERPLSLDEAGQSLSAGLNKTVSNNKAHESFWNNFNSIPSRALGAVNDARLAAGKALGEGAYALGSMGPDAWTGGAKPGMTPGVTAPSGNKAAPGMLDQIMKSPYTPYIAGGVGTAGALGLLYAMSRRKKKQRQEQEMGEDEGGALAYGKAATFGLTGASIGALGGLATSKPGRRNRAVGRGAVIGAGTEIGGITGGALGALLGAGLGGAKSTGGNPGASLKNMGFAGIAGAGLGALGGGVLGNMAGRGLLEQNPYEDDEEKKAGNAGTGSADAYYDKKPEKMNTYEASEGVKGLTPKLQYEEHKKMSPQEFGVKAAVKMAAGPAGPFGTNKGNPSALQSYGNTLDRWYNPWSKQQGLERGEEGLMRAGQGSMGVAGLAGAAALAPAAGLGAEAAATFAPAAGLGGSASAATPITAGQVAAYGGVLGSLSAGHAGLQAAIHGPGLSQRGGLSRIPTPDAPTAAAPKPPAPAPAVPK